LAGPISAPHLVARRSGLDPHGQAHVDERSGRSDKSLVPQRVEES